MDYGYPERRKTKTDKRAKARYQKYKQGGTHRTAQLGQHGLSVKK